jgi:hypothetical protein
MKREGRRCCKLAFGPYAPGFQGYLAWKTDEFKAFACIPPETPAGVQWRQVRHLQLATFGVDWAYFFLQTDGIFSYNFMGRYNLLDTIIQHYQLKAGDIKVCK